MKKFLIALAMLATVGLGLPAIAAEPTVHEIYQAAEAGKMDDAQRMIHEVLAAHPNSGRAHYIEADLLAKQGKVHQAASELATAERLAPGLPFATAQSVSSLRQVIGSETSARTRVEHAPVTNDATQPAAVSSFPWGMVLGGAGLILFIAWAVRFMTSRNAPAPAGYGGGGYGPGYPAGSPQAPYGGMPQGYGPGAAAPGLGSQMLGGLATGAAVGVGVVAAEGLMHHMLDGNHSSSGGNTAYTPFQSIPDDDVPVQDDMGGNDFGVSDGSWDDGGGGGGGGSDWN